MSNVTNEGIAALRAAAGNSEAPLSSQEAATLFDYFRNRCEVCVAATKGGFLRGLSHRDAMLIALGEIWSRHEISSLTSSHGKGELVNALRRICIARGADFPSLVLFGVISLTLVVELFCRPSG
jgi:hypothetical protein